MNIEFGALSLLIQKPASLAKEDRVHTGPVNAINGPFARLLNPLIAFEDLLSELDMNSFWWMFEDALRLVKHAVLAIIKDP